jgi:DNA-binding transcriptional LysR family regulator
MVLINRIKPRHLDLVIKVAETKQLQLAARQVNISQPAASRILHDLESQFGVSFFDRHPTGMEPTPAGLIFLRHARSALTELTTLSAELEHLKSGQIGAVRVGTVTGPAAGHLMPAVRAVLRQHPELRIYVDVEPSSRLFRGLQEAQYDFILGRANPHHNPVDFRFHPGRKEVVSLMVHSTHPLAKRDKVSLAETSDFPWVIQEEGSPIREAVEQAFHTEAVPVPPRVLNSSSLLVALTRVAEGTAIAPQANEVTRLLMSTEINADLSVLNTQSDISVAPYFVIQSAQRELSRAAERLLREVMSRF